MYIQPYEPQEMPFGPAPLSGYGTQAQGCMPSEFPYALDGIDDASGALNDAPFGALGMGNMLSSLAGMMQQLASMLQSLLGRMSGESGTTSHCGNGCTQGPPQMRRLE